MIDSELFTPSDEEIHIPTFEDMLERFKSFVRDILDDESDETLDFPEIIRDFEKTCLTNTEIDAIESSLNEFLNVYNEVIE